MQTHRASQGAMESGLGAHLIYISYNYIDIIPQGTCHSFYERFSEVVNRLNLSLFSLNCDMTLCSRKEKS